MLVLFIFIYIYRPINDTVHPTWIFQWGLHGGNSPKSTFGHNFWLECPRDLWLTSLSCIFDSLFGDTPFGHIFFANAHMPICPIFAQKLKTGWKSVFRLFIIWEKGTFFFEQRCPQRQKNPVCEYALHTGKFLRVRKVFARIYKIYPNICLESFQTVWKVSRQSGKFPDSLETFRTVWTVSGQSGKFLDSLESFQTVWKVSGQSGKFPVSLESFRTVWKIYPKIGL